MVFTAEGILATASQQKKAQADVDTWIEDSPRLRAQQVSVEGATVSVRVTGSQQLPPPKELQATLSDSLGKPVDLVIDYTPSLRVDVSSDGQLDVEESPTTIITQ